MQVEHSVRVFPLDQDLEANLQQMTNEGWILLPGVAPVAVYHVCRMPGMPAHGAPQGNEVKAVASITIDDTKVKILRNGELIDG